MKRLPSAPVRLAAIIALAGVLLLAGAGPAAAHVEATPGDGARAGDGPVTVAFAAEAESPTSGIAGIKTQLPGGVLPEWVSLASGPAGWTLTPTTDGYEIAGPELAPGTDADYTITVAQLPADRTEFVFKTLVRYSDGSEDAWIEEPTADNPEPQNPAPVITVAPASAAATTATPTETSAPATSAPATPTAASQAQTPDEDGTPTSVIVLGILVVAAAVAGAVVYMRRSRSRS